MRIASLSISWALRLSAWLSALCRCYSTAASCRTGSARPRYGIEATISGVALYLFIVHTATATDRSFLNRDLLKNLNFTAGTVLMFMVGLIMNGTLALLPTMLQDLMNYPVLTTGLVTAPRGIGSMIGMFAVA